MNRRCRQLLAAVAVMLVMAVLCSPAVFASDDNSLASLGIRTEGARVSPEFRYDIWEYTVEVPAGTTELDLEPHTTNPSATVNSVTGTTLSEDGTGRVVITVTSESGDAIEYILNVISARPEMDPAEAIAANESSAAVTIDTEVVQSEVETEDPRYVKVDRNSLQDAENTIEKLQKTITEQRSHINMLTYVLYALIAVSIIFLFIVISQLLRRRDMAQELAFYKQEDPYHTSVGEDGWGEWGEDDIDRGGRRRKKSAADDGWDEEPVNPASEWANQQVGTPVRPQHYASKQQAPREQGNRDRGQAPREQGNRDRGQAPREQGGRDRSQALAQAGSRQASVKTQGTGDETKRYEAVPPVHPQEVPKDVTKDLSRVNKAEAKAMKKAAAAETKREMDEKRAERARAEEAKRQAKEAQRLEKEQEAARRAQENALQEAERREAEEKQVSANPDAEKGKNVEINMVDL